MAYTFKTNLANRKNYGNWRNTANIQYIVIHYTANDGDTDENNGLYFKRNVVQCSAHYFVDSDSITQTVPDNYESWSVGGNRWSDYKKTGGAKFYGKATHANTLNIEICDDTKNGTIYPSAATIDNAVSLTRMLMKKYNIPAERVIRHFDVTGKHCPAYWCASAGNDNLWKAAFWYKISGVNVENKPVEEPETNGSFLVKVICESLNVRNGAGVLHKINTVVHKGEVYTIVETKGNWGKLKSGAGWMNISDKYCKRV